MVIFWIAVFAWKKKYDISFDSPSRSRPFCFGYIQNFLYIEPVRKSL